MVMAIQSVAQSLRSAAKRPGRGKAARTPTTGPAWYRWAIASGRTCPCGSGSSDVQSTSRLLNAPQPGALSVGRPREGALADQLRPPSSRNMNRNRLMKSR